MSHPSNPPPYDVVYVHGTPMQPIQMQPQPQVIINGSQYQTHIIQGTGPLDISPSHIVCRNCNHTVMTRTEMKPAMRTHCCAACLFVFGLWPCCFIPYCMPSCNNIDHYCPKCNAYIGSYTG